MIIIDRTEKILLCPMTAKLVEFIIWGVIDGIVSLINMLKRYYIFLEVYLGNLEREKYTVHLFNC